MKNFKWWVLGIVLILVVPVLPYEKETTDGVVEVSNQSISSYIYERYELTQKKATETEVKEEDNNLHAPVAQ